MWRTSPSTKFIADLLQIRQAWLPLFWALIPSFKWGRVNTGEVHRIAFPHSVVECQFSVVMYDVPVQYEYVCHGLMGLTEFSPVRFGPRWSGGDGRSKKEEGEELS